MDTVPLDLTHRRKTRRQHLPMFEGCQQPLNLFPQFRDRVLQQLQARR